MAYKENGQKENKEERIDFLRNSKPFSRTKHKKVNLKANPKFKTKSRSTLSLHTSPRYHKENSKTNAKT